MNATATAAAPAALKSPPAIEALKHIVLGDIELSSTPMQKMRRQRFDKTALEGLAASIKIMGVLQPVLVRKHQKWTQGGEYWELVAGERRFLAAKQAGLSVIPATIRELTDLQVLEMQVVENNQRKDLHELIEAEGFDTLMKQHKLTADEIAAKVGKSRRHVFNRLKLCDLCPEARTAFYDNKIGGTVAFQIARIGHHDTQRECLRALLHGAGKDEQPTKRYAEQLIRENYLLNLDGKAFPIGDATLCPKAGACGPCPKRTGNQAELFDDIKGNGNICTDAKCFGDKANAFTERRRAEAIKAGRTVITGKAAKEIMPHQYSSMSGAVKPDDTCYDDPKYRTYKQILGKEAPQTALLENPHKKGEMIEVWPKADISKVLKEKLPEKKKVTSHSGNTGPSKDTQEIKQRVDAELFRLINTKHSGKLGPVELLDIAFPLADNVSSDSALYKHWKIPESYDAAHRAISKLSEKDLTRFIIGAIAMDGINFGSVSGTAVAMCKSLKIDPKKVTKDVEAAYKKEKAAAAKKTPAPAAKKKAAPATTTA